jgi:hypothetical protein
VERDKTSGAGADAIEAPATVVNSANLSAGSNDSRTDRKKKRHRH